MAKEVKLTLSERKKNSGKYVVEGTEGDRYPSYFYLPYEWFGGEKPPYKVKLTVESLD